MEVRKSPVYIAADGTSRKELVNVSGGTLYYKSTESVSSSSNDGSVTAGRRMELTAGLWVVSASETDIALRPLSAIQESAASPVVGTFGRRLLRKLDEGLEDCSIAVVGDSTSAGYTTWVGKVLDGLATRYPAYTVKYRDWTDGGTDYNAASTKQTGTGSKTLTLYNSAVASKSAYYQMAPYFDTMIAAKQPDLIFFNHGHNHGGPLTEPEPAWRDDLTIATETVTRACPLSEVVLIAANPRTDTSATVGAQRQFITEQVAQMRGFGFVNAHRLFLDADPSLASVLQDEIHPNATGYTLLADEILRLLNVSGRLGSQQPSSFLAPATSLLTNGDFASFESPPTLPSWTGTNVTISKDLSNFESPNGYAVKLVVTTPGSSSRITQTIGAAAQRAMRGQWVTMLSRAYIPSGMGVYPGRTNIQENNGSHTGTTTSNSLAGGQGAFRWIMCSRRIAADCTSVSFHVNAELTAAGEVTLDRVIVVRGALPRDIR